MATYPTEERNTTGLAMNRIAGTTGSNDDVLLATNDAIDAAHTLAAAASGSATANAAEVDKLKLFAHVQYRPMAVGATIDLVVGAGVDVTIAHLTLITLNAESSGSFSYVPITGVLTTPLGLFQPTMTLSARDPGGGPTLWAFKFTVNAIVTTPQITRGALLDPMDVAMSGPFLRFLPAGNTLQMQASHDQAGARTLRINYYQLALNWRKD